LAVAATGASATPVPAPPGSTAAQPTATPGPSATPAPSVDTAALYRGIEDQVIEERGLPAKKRLEPTVVSEAEARTRIVEQFEKDNPADEIAVAEETLQALGLLPSGASLGELYVDLLGSQVAGFYDPETQEMVVVSRSGKIGGNEGNPPSSPAPSGTRAGLRDRRRRGQQATARWDGSRGGGRRASDDRWLASNLTAAELGGRCRSTGGPGTLSGCRRSSARRCSSRRRASSS
jgi:hypothetical protein